MSSSKSYFHFVCNMNSFIGNINLTKLLTPFGSKFFGFCFFLSFGQLEFGKCFLFQKCTKLRSTNFHLYFHCYNNTDKFLQ